MIRRREFCERWRLALCSGGNSSSARTNSAGINFGHRYAWALMLAAVLLTASPGAWSDSVKIIANSSLDQSELDRSMVRSMFSVRLRQWPDGSPVKAFVLPDSDPVHQQFCREQLGTFPYVLRATWDRVVFTGTGIAPEVVKSEQEMKRKVESTPGSIGYVLVPAPEEVNAMPSLSTGVVGVITQ